MASHIATSPFYTYSVDGRGIQIDILPPTAVYAVNSIIMTFFYSSIMSIYQSFYKTKQNQNRHHIVLSEPFNLQAESVHLPLRFRVQCSGAGQASPRFHRRHQFRGHIRLMVLLVHQKVLLHQTQSSSTGRAAPPSCPESPPFCQSLSYL